MEILKWLVKLPLGLLWSGTEWHRHLRKGALDSCSGVAKPLKVLSPVFMPEAPTKSAMAGLPFPERREREREKPLSRSYLINRLVKKKIILARCHKGELPPEN